MQNSRIAPYTVTVMHLLLLKGELLPVTLLLGPQGSNFTLILLEPMVKNCETGVPLKLQDAQPDCRERGHNTVNVGNLAVGTITYDFPASNVNLSQKYKKTKFVVNS